MGQHPYSCPSKVFGGQARAEDSGLSAVETRVTPQLSGRHEAVAAWGAGKSSARQLPAGAHSGDTAPGPFLEPPGRPPSSR